MNQYIDSGDIKIMLVGLIGLVMYLLLIPTYINLPFDVEVLRAEMPGRDLVCKEK